MSILLEALRKSERRDRAGRVPDIHADTPVPAGDPGHGRVRALAVVVLVLLVAVLALWAWQFGVLERLWPVDAPASATQATMPEPLGTQAATATEPVAEQPGETSPEPATVAASEPPPESAPAMPAPAQVGANGPRTPMEAVQIPVPTQPQPQADGPATTVERAPPPPANVQLQRPPAGPPTASDLEGGSAHEAAPKQATTPSFEPISFGQLPAALRSELPPLRLTVLVWAEDPAARFALLDGKRRAEGDEVAPGLRVVEVRRDGVVLGYRAYQFLVRN